MSHFFAIFSEMIGLSVQILTLSFFLSYNMNIQTCIIFYFFPFPTSQNNPCCDPSTVEYRKHALRYFLNANLS